MTPDCTLAAGVLLDSPSICQTTKIRDKKCSYMSNRINVQLRDKLDGGLLLLRDTPCRESTCRLWAPRRPSPLRSSPPGKVAAAMNTEYDKWVREMLDFFRKTGPEDFGQAAGRSPEGP